MNTLNQFTMTVNDKEIQRVENAKRAGRFLCEVQVNGKTRRQWTGDLPEHLDTCNVQGWHIESVTLFIPERVKEYHSIPENNVR